MSNTKFTKGPWQFHGNDGSITDTTKAENSIAFVELAGWDSLNEGWHNAHLIAAAPEMYEMIHSLSTELLHMIRKENSRLLQNISTTDLDDPDYLTEESVYLAQKLLAKARGE